MPAPPNAATPRLAGLIARRQPGHRSSAKFYLDEDIYRAELERIWRRGGSSRATPAGALPEPGDYFTFEVDGDSVIIVRRRRRGACAPPQRLPASRHRRSVRRAGGHVRRLVCPYHQWTYGRDGALLACRGMQEDLDRSQLGLQPVHVRGGRRADLHLARRRARRRSTRRASVLAPLPAAAGLRARQGGEGRRLRRRAPTGSSCGRTTASATTATSTTRSTSRPTSTTTTPTTPSRASRRPIDRGRGAQRGASGPPPGWRSRTQQTGMTAVPRRRAQHLVLRQPHAAGRRLRQRDDGRPAGGAADGRLHRRRRRHAAHAHAAQLLEPLELRPRRQHTPAPAGRPAARRAPA